MKLSVELRHFPEVSKASYTAMTFSACALLLGKTRPAHLKIRNYSWYSRHGA